jgi:hypothetical protein
LTQNHRPGYTYYFSAILNQQIARHERSGRVYCQERNPSGELIYYTKDEIDLLHSKGEKIDMAAHTVKKVFEGVIVDVIIQPEEKVAVPELELF